jgi:Kef-type K+ transport system membrane component KefB
VGSPPEPPPWLMASTRKPFLAAFGFGGLVLGWHLHAAEIGGIALSTTSVAVVYAVLVETGLNRHDLGKLILAACFITDLGTVLALGGLFASYGRLLLVFVAVSAVTVALLPRLLRLAIRFLGHRVSEPEIKLLLVVLFGLGGLATAQQLFRPAIVDGDEEEALGGEDISIIRHQPGLSSTHDQPLD